MRSHETETPRSADIEFSLTRTCSFDLGYCFGKEFGGFEALLGFAGEGEDDLTEFDDGDYAYFGGLGWL